MHNKTVLISGAGIAGPALAYWLRRYGFQPTVVERTPELRDGGQAADFRGTARMTVLRRMGILDEVRRQQTERTRMVVIDGAGRPQVSLPAGVAARRCRCPRSSRAARSRSCAVTSPASSTTGPATAPSPSSATGSPRWPSPPTGSG
ncbi:FAD-dependent monooxygenase [Saccharopolyspora sp. NPDC000995]